MPDPLPPHIVLFAKALRARQIARFLMGKDSPEAQRTARIIEAGARFRLGRAKEMLAEDRRTQGDASTALSRVEHMLVKAEYCRQMAAWLSEAPRAGVETRKFVARLTAVADVLAGEAQRMASEEMHSARDGTRGSA